MTRVRRSRQHHPRPGRSPCRRAIPDATGHNSHTVLGDPCRARLTRGRHSSLTLQRQREDPRRRRYCDATNGMEYRTEIFQRPRLPHTALTPPTSRFDRHCPTVKFWFPSLSVSVVPSLVISEQFSCPSTYRSTARTVVLNRCRKCCCRFYRTHTPCHS